MNHTNHKKTTCSALLDIPSYSISECLEDGDFIPALYENNHVINEAKGNGIYEGIYIGVL